MDIVLRDLFGNECYVSIGDVILYGNTIEVHASRLGHVLESFVRANLQLQPSKCVLAQPQVEYLGYVISRDGNRASPDKTTAVKNFPVPRNTKEVRSFLELASFCRRLVPKFAQIAKPLMKLLRKDMPFAWTERQNSAFENLKTYLCSEQVMAYPDFSSQFILTANASKVPVAPILSQVQDGVECPISFASRQLNSAEQNYSASEGEMLAVSWGTYHCRCYLYGKRFVLRTGHAALRYLHTFSENNSRLFRWSLKLSEFDFTVEHRPRTQIRHADALSRALQTIALDEDLSRE